MTGDWVTVSRCLEVQPLPSFSMKHDWTYGLAFLGEVRDQGTDSWYMTHLHACGETVGLKQMWSRDPTLLFNLDWTLDWHCQWQAYVTGVTPLNAVCG